MNTIAEIKRINSKQLEVGEAGSWHDQYKDSAYIYVGGLPFQLTEGDVITIFSQYGEIVDISMPRDPATQKPRGFAFLMYADQRSTVLAVDNLGGAKVLDRMLRVDHVLNYKHLEKDQETGKMKEREAPSMIAHPEKFWKAKNEEDDSNDGAESDSSHPSIDLDDPMRDYLIEQKRKAKGKSAGKTKHEGETKEERKKRRDEKRRIKGERARRKGTGGAGENRIEGASSWSHSRRGDISKGDGRSRRDDDDRRTRGDDRNDDRRRRDDDEYDRDHRRRRDDGGYDRSRGDDREKTTRDVDDNRRRDSRPSGGRSSAFADLEKAVGMR